jgi:hypothetical protein
LILSPDYFSLITYLSLVWQLQAFMNEGYQTESFMNSLISLRNAVIALAFLLFGIQVVLTVLYLVEITAAEDLLTFLTTIDFAIPLLVALYFLHLKCQVSGLP